MGNAEEVLSENGLYRFSRAEYARLGDVLRDRRVELVYGVITQMSPQGLDHVQAVRALNALLMGRLLGRALVMVQQPIAAADDSEPEPDLAVVENADFRHALPTRPLLVVEVSGSTLGYDRNVKRRLYAEAGIPEYWIVDLGHRCVEKYAAPEGGRYTRLSTHGPGESLAPEAFPDVLVPLAELLPLPPT